MSDAHGEDYFNPYDGWVLDWNDRQNPRFDPKQNPLNGYGLNNTMQVYKLHQRGHQNSDNYNWFAFEGFFSAKCDHVFDRPVYGADVVYVIPPENLVPL